MAMEYQEDLIRLIEKSGAHPAQGMKHCMRVYYLAKEMAQHLSLDDEILYISALLHDTGKYPAYILPNVDHVLRSKGVASNFLNKVSFPPHKIPLVLESIETHMHYSEPGKSDEAVYLRDANILDNLGNIGLMRLFSMVGQDQVISTPEDAVERARMFAEALPGKTFTKVGRRLAIKRREEMLRFLAGIKRQTTEFAYI